MPGIVYFGNREKFTAIPAPLTGADGSDIGSGGIITLLNGGAIVEDSVAQHREFSFDWIGDPAAFAVVRAFRQGVNGAGPYWWVDPFAWDVNGFAPNWAAPRLTDEDWKEISDYPHTGSVATPANSYGHPGKSATYDFTAAALGFVPARRFTILIPTGMTLRVGASGTATNAHIAVRPILLSDAYDTVVYNAPLSVTAAPRYFATTYSSATYKGVEVYLSKSAAGASTLTLSSMSAILALTTATPVTSGPWVPGEGTTGMRFSGNIRNTLYTVGGRMQIRKKGFGVKLVETEAWEL